MKNVRWSLFCLCSILLLLAACSSRVPSQPLSSNSLSNNSPGHKDLPQVLVPTPPAMPIMSIPSQQVTPTPHTGSGSRTGSPPPAKCVTFSTDTTHVPAKNGGLAAPYGSAPTSSEAQQLAQQLLQLINANRVACGLPAFSWSSTLASGALLHSWNMSHCGFSHTCPDGSAPCQRIANEGFAGLSDCGENIGEAGPSSPAWTNVANIQNSMENEPVSGWHRIHLFSTTLHRIGIGVYINSGGWVYFTEDMVA